jgi:uncharacterized protein YbjT (DUF2867 family)
MAEQPFLVLGATGGQGGAVTTTLLARGTGVRALVRSSETSGAARLSERGVETVTGSLDDADSLTAAMTGTAGVFAVTTPFEAGPEAEVTQGQAIITAATRAGVGHLVFSSVAGADQHTGVGHFDSKARVEADLAAAGVPYTILGPTYFFDNALGGADRIRAGVLDLPLPGDRPLQQLARADHGALAAQVLLHPDDYAGRRIELASDAPTPLEMATALTHATGHNVHHEQVPLDTITNPDMHAMWSFLNGSGYHVELDALHSAHPEVAWTSFHAWAAETLTS